MLVVPFVAFILILPVTKAVPSQVNPPTVAKAVSSGKPALTVSWSAPQSDSTITKYELQYRKTPSGGWISRNVTSTPTTIDALDAGTEYTVRVRAVSGVGNGPFSMEQRQTTFNVPSKVTGVRLSVVSGQAAIRVYWTKPSSDSTIIRYVVQYGPSPARSNGWTNTIQVQGADSLTTTLTGLARRSYDVRVVAVSDAGFGLYSTTSTLSTVRVPSQVNPPTVTKVVSSGKPALNVSWSEPQSYNPITKYELQYRKTSDRSWMSIYVTSTSTTLPNLDAGTEYTVQVRAVSGVGNGLFSSEIRQTSFNVPSQLTEVILSDVSSSSVSVQAAIKVTWTKPSSDRPIIRYVIQYGLSPAHSNGWTTIQVLGADTLTTTLAGLGRRSYDVRVAAVSDVGYGLYRKSTLSTARVPSQVSPPTVTKAVSSGRPALTVSWSAPQSDSSITKYELQYKKITESRWMSNEVTSTSTTLTNLDAGTEYTVQVRAVSGVGNGPFSVKKRQTTFNVPQQIAPQTLTRSVSCGPTLTVGWIKPISEVTITGYDVQYKLSSASANAWSENIRLGGADTLSSLEHVLPRLSVGTSYDVRVRAVSEAGYGPFGLASERTYKGPSMVSSVNFTTSESSGSVNISLTWKAPPSEVPITHYEVMYSESGMTKPTFTSSTPGATINGTANKEYFVCIKAVSAVGSGRMKCTNVAPPVVDPTSSLDSHVGVIVGAFVAGLVAGVLGLLLVEGIMFGACKLTKQPNINGSKENGSDPNAVEMTECPAYESVDKAYEGVDQTAQQRYVPKNTNEEYAIIN